ncbi:MAG: SPFH domain-containing protein, partial [Gammaproteobacteria bacterium]
MKKKSVKSITDIFSGSKKNAENASMATPLLLILGAFTIFKAIYTVPSDSIALIQRFGEYKTETQSGLHFKVPFIDKATILPNKRQMKQEFGFTTPGATNRYQSAPDLNMQKDMVTGDLNAVQVEWV